MFSKPASAAQSSGISRNAGGQAEEFWTSQLVKSFMKMQRGLDQQYDNYFK